MQLNALCNRSSYACILGTNGLRFLTTSTEGRSGYTAKNLRFVAKTLRVMQLTAIFLTVCTMTVCARSASQSVTYSGKNVPLKQIFQVVHDQTDYLFVYKTKLLENAQPVTIQANQMPLSDFLFAILKDQPLTYSILNTTITIKPKGINIHPILSLHTLPITGIISSVHGTSLSGASINIKGKNRGVISDENGRFTITADKGDILIVSFTGYQLREYKIGDDTNINISLLVADEKLQEVTISTGYYSTTKAKSTMNIEKIGGKDIQDQPVTNLMSALSGRVAGLDITPYNGAAGVAPKIQIRGNNSLRFDGSYPLYVIDGIQIDPTPIQTSSSTIAQTGFDPLGALNPADIESIEVLKDAAATAIYGSRGANGVIRITMKQNKQLDKTRFDFNIYSGVGKVADRIDLLNSREYIAMRRETFTNDGLPFPDKNTPFDFNFDVNGQWDTARYTDWQKVLLGGSTKITDIQFGFLDGNKNTSFRLSGGFHKETVPYDGDFEYKRGTISFSLNHLSSNEKFSATLSVLYGADNNRLFENNNFISDALTLPPTAPALYDANGQINWEEFEFFPGFVANTWTNPLSKLANTVDFKSGTLTGNALLSYKILNGLVLRANLGYNESHSRDNVQQPIIASAPFLRPSTEGVSKFTANNRLSYQVEPQIVFNRQINDHVIEILTGGSFRQSQMDHSFIEAKGYKSDELLATIKGANSINYLADDYSQYKYVSLFARAAYSFKSKYLVDVSGRRDGSSRFGPGRRFGNFGAAGIGWVFSKENVFANQSVLSFGKLRASYGLTGNDQIGDYNYYKSYIIAPIVYQNTVSIIPKSLLNPDYAWERTTKTEIAVELGFLNNRINLQTAWYRNISNNQLVDYPLPATTGFPNILQNFNAVIENTGFELLINSINISSKYFRWSTSVNFTVPKNKLKSFIGIEQSPYAELYKVGEPLSISSLYIFKGIDPLTGNYLIDDINGDGFFTPSDRQFMKPLQREYFGGILNTLSYKNFELSFLLRFSKGNSANWLPRSAPGNLALNFPAFVLDHWQKPGDIAQWGRYSMDGQQATDYDRVTRSSISVKDALFLRLQTLSFSYRIPNRLLSKLSLSETRIFIQGQNLFTLSDFPALDPETVNSLPPLRMLTFGCQLTF